MTSKKAKGPSTKTVQKAKAKVAEDLTFGLKNKNKSKQVQKQIQAIKTQVTGGNQKRRALDPAEERKLQKQLKKEKEKELKALFNVVEDKKPKQQAVVVEEEPEEEPEPLTIEEQIEEERACVTTRTPVTKDLFMEFVAMKKAEREAERNKGKEQITGLTGLGLFSKNASIFVDDDNAAGADELEIIEEGLFEGEEFDEDLFAEEEETGREYDPENWSEVKTPKELLQDYLEKNSLTPAKYVPVPVKGGSHIVKVVLPHLDKKEFTPSGAYKSKKIAEHNAALMAYDYLMAQDTSEGGEQ